MSTLGQPGVVPRVGIEGLAVQTGQFSHSQMRWTVPYRVTTPTGAQAGPTVNMPDELEREVESRLAYGDSKSGWMREAIKLRLDVDPLLDDRFGDHEQEARREFVVEAVQEKLERE